jgi:hypothetical protein
MQHDKRDTLYISNATKHNLIQSLLIAQAFMEPECSLPRSQKHAVRLISEPAEYSQYR